VIGQIYIEGDLRIGGTIEGEVEVTGDVEVDDMAKVKASLAGRDVSIRGQVNGAVVARKRLVIARSGSLTGDVQVARLIIQDGAAFSGKVSMGGAAEGRPARAAEPEAPAAKPEVKALPEAPPPIIAAPVAAAPAPKIASPPAQVAVPKVTAAAAQAPAARGKAGKTGKATAAPTRGKPKRR
jgi:cytoskeletal protein CcmA (bactofilin family)